MPINVTTPTPAALTPVALLGQSDPPNAARDLVEYYVLEHPVLGMLAVLLVGIVAAEVLRRTGRGRAAAWTLAGALLVGAGIVGIGTAVETPRECVTLQTRAFVDAIVGARAADVGKLLAERVTFRTDGRVNVTLDRDWVLSVAKGMDNGFKSHSMEVLDVSLANNATSALSRFISRDEFTSDPFGPVPSTWEFTWRKDSGTDTWRITAIECVTIFGKPATNDWVNWGNQHRR